MNLWRAILLLSFAAASCDRADTSERAQSAVGHAGEELCVHPLMALDAGSGRIAWRAYSTGPDSEVLIGPSFRPFYASDRSEDLGVSTWPLDQWRLGGGTVWGWIYGDNPTSLFQSIAQGRPNGMPSFGLKLPDEQIWKIALFVQSLGEQPAAQGGTQGGPTEATRRRQPSGAGGRR